MPCVGIKKLATQRQEKPILKKSVQNYVLIPTSPKSLTRKLIDIVPLPFCVSR